MTALAHPSPVRRPAAPSPASGSPASRRLTLVPDVASDPADELPRLATVIPFPTPAPARPRTRAAAPRPRVATEPTATPVRLTARGRRVVVGLALVLAAVLGSTAGALVSSATEAPAEVATVTVTTGESLWTIASAAAGPDADVRDVMAQIVALNELDDHTVHAGQSLVVPVVG